jgi:phosphoglycerol transferase MdoB-like AlkP superfamily enzyme
MNLLFDEIGQGLDTLLLIAIILGVIPIIVLPTTLIVSGSENWYSKGIKLNIFVFILFAISAYFFLSSYLFLIPIGFITALIIHLFLSYKTKKLSNKTNKKR